MYTHEYNLIPALKSKIEIGDDDLNFDEELTATCKLESADLKGDYLVNVTMTEDEIYSLITQLFKRNPEKSIRMILKCKDKAFGELQNRLHRNINT